MNGELAVAVLCIEFWGHRTVQPVSLASFVCSGYTYFIWVLSTGKGTFVHCLSSRREHAHLTM